MRYTALSLRLPEPSALIFGSNMGGKTVVLQTMLFLQVLAQSGFLVPAESFMAPLFPFIHFVGEGATREVRVDRGAGGGEGGLSGFGREIRSLVEALGSAASGGFLAFDEFARTTSSGEAEALLSAVLAALVQRPGIKALFATHFRGVARVDGARRLRMRGLDREALAESGVGGGGSFGKAESGDGGRAESSSEVTGYEGAVARLNSLMRYELVEDEGGDGRSDALLVAGLLGLDPGIVGKAEALFAGAHPGAPRDLHDDEGKARREG